MPIATEFPNMGVAKTEYADGIRMLAYQRHLILFSVADNKIVLIERILHSARNLSEILSKK